MSKNQVTAKDLVIAPGQAEETAADMLMVVRNAKLAGHFSVMEGEVRPQELLVFHTHSNEDQHMYILNGELHFEVGGADGIRFTAGAGCHVLKPRGSSHGFWNLGEDTVRYIETSTEGGFEAFIDSRQDGVAAMVHAGNEELGMSFEIKRALQVMREFRLTGLAGINLPEVSDLLEQPAIIDDLKTSVAGRELPGFLAKAKQKLAEAVGC